MFYQNLKFPKVKGRPFFYTNFVQTVDGKVAVKKPGYWPIGSKTDHLLLTELRDHADCLVHGKNLAAEFGEITLKSLAEKNLNLPYLVAQRPLKEFVRKLHKKGYKNVLVEGGPTLLGSFLKAGFLDEIFLTIAPKIFGTEKDATLTLVENYLFPKKAIKKLKLKSVKQIENELYLRYEVLN